MIHLLSHSIPESMLVVARGQRSIADISVDSRRLGRGGQARDGAAPPVLVQRAPPAVDEILAAAQIT